MMRLHSLEDSKQVKSKMCPKFIKSKTHANECYEFDANKWIFIWLRKQLVNYVNMIQDMKCIYYWLASDNYSSTWISRNVKHHSERYSSKRSCIYTTSTLNTYHTSRQHGFLLHLKLSVTNMNKFGTKTTVVTRITRKAASMAVS